MDWADDPSDLPTPEQQMGLEQVRQQQGDDILWANPQIGEKTRCLMDLVQQDAIGDTYRSIQSVTFSKQGYGRLLWPFRRCLSNQLVGRANGEAFCERLALAGFKVLDGA